MTTRRLLLFDIDGTLVRAGPVGGAVFNRALEAVLGEVPSERVRMSGKTDPQIVREYLALMESDDPDHLPSILKHLERELAAAAAEITRDGSPCPGAVELLEAVTKDDRFYSSVLTGNIAPNAVVKLAAFGLEKWLDLECGAYGSDSEDRRDLVPIAIGRDYECAAAAGAHCLLVATGSYSVEELSGVGADAVSADLTGTDAVVDILSAGL